MEVLIFQRKEDLFILQKNNISPYLNDLESQVNVFLFLCLLIQSDVLVLQPKGAVCVFGRKIKDTNWGARK